mmetsp:Transcript_60048/g.178781  ORF Transcript_60048/g.178781 Transcript_60048/m.178781 type:complete len:362 (+) Transcript_60048:2-1087(+)
MRALGRGLNTDCLSARGAGAAFLPDVDLPRTWTVCSARRRSGRPSWTPSSGRARSSWCRRAGPRSPRTRRGASPCAGGCGACKFRGAGRPLQTYPWAGLASPKRRPSPLSTPCPKASMTRPTVWSSTPSAEEALRSAGLWQIAERVEGVDGREVDLDGVDSALATAEAVAEARRPPERVVGVKLTRGALGLLVTWHRLLSRAEAELQPHECALIAEDDARYAPDFSHALARLMGELDLYDPRWEAVQVGYYPATSKSLPLTMMNGLLPKLICQPLLMFGCVGVLVRGFGVARLRRALFPVREGQQLDSAFSGHAGELRVYASAVPLAAAVPSECGDTDIQILGAGEAESSQLMPSSYEVVD